MDEERAREERQLSPGGCVLIYERLPGKVRRLVRWENPFGTVHFFRGEGGSERHVSTTFANGVVVSYEGEGRSQRKLKTTFPSGEATYFEGERGEERVVRVLYPCGAMVHYEGEQGREHKVRTVLPTGQTTFLDGGKGFERWVKSTFPSGEVHYFEGKRGRERKVKVIHPCGEVKHYEGERGFEREVRTAPDAPPAPVQDREAEERAMRVALELIEEEECRKASAARKASAKAAKKKAAKQKKAAAKLARVPEDEAAAPAAAPAVLSLSELDFALDDMAGAVPCIRETDAATSVATSLACVICMAKERSVACVPCGHRCLCNDCGKPGAARGKCPMCRHPVQAFVRIFL